MTSEPCETIIWKEHINMGWSFFKKLLGVAEVAADIAVKNPENRKIMEKVQGAVDQVVDTKAAQEEQKKEAEK